MTSFWMFSFFKESYSELKKSTWLTRKEMMQSTMVVIVLVCIVAVYVGAVDFVLSIVMGSLLSSR